MDDESRQVKQLLTRLADAQEPFAAPSLNELLARRRRPWRAVTAVITAAAVVVAVAVGLTIIRNHTDTRTAAQPPISSPAPALPAPSGPAVNADTLKRYRWTSLPPAPITPRGDAASAWTGNSLIVWGGDSGTHLYNDGAEYNPASGRWTTLPPAPLGARMNPLSAWVDGSFIVWGGATDAEGHHAVDGARYQPSTGHWTMLKAAPVTTYAWADLVVAGGAAVLLSGATMNANQIRVDVYDPRDDAWKSQPGPEPAQSSHGILGVTALGIGPTAVVWAYWSHATKTGAGSTSTASGVDAYSFDVAKGIWTSAPLQPDQGRDPGQPLWTGSKILLLGEGIYCGMCSHPPSINSPSVAIDPTTGTRSSFPTSPVNGDGFADYFWTGSAILAVDTDTSAGPSDPIFPGSAAVWDQPTNAWTRIGSTRLHPNGSSAAAAWTGNRLIIWGIGASSQFAPPHSS